MRATHVVIIYLNVVGWGLRGLGRVVSERVYYSCRKFVFMFLTTQVCVQHPRVCFRHPSEMVFRTLTSMEYNVLVRHLNQREHVVNCHQTGLLLRIPDLHRTSCARTLCAFCLFFVMLEFFGHNRLP